MTKESLVSKYTAIKQCKFIVRQKTIYITARTLENTCINNVKK